MMGGCLMTWANTTTSKPGQHLVRGNPAKKFEVAFDMTENVTFWFQISLIKHRHHPATCDLTDGCHNHLSAI